MKTLILFIVAIYISLNVVSQCRVGYSLEEIYNEYKDSHKIDTVTLGKSLFVKITLSESIAYHLFNEEGNCFITIIKPSTDKKMQDLIKKYNEIYKFVYDGLWIAIIKDVRIKIEKKAFTELGVCFAMSLYD